MNKQIITLITVMILLTALRMYIPYGVATGLLFSIPLFMATTINVARWIIPSTVFLVILISLLLPNGNHPINTTIYDNTAMVMFLLVLGYLGSLRCKRQIGKICTLQEMNEHLACRIQYYDELKEKESK